MLQIPRKLEQESLIVNNKAYQINIINSLRLKDRPAWRDSDKKDELRIKEVMKKYKKDKGYNSLKESIEAESKQKNSRFWMN